MTALSQGSSLEVTELNEQHEEAVMGSAQVQGELWGRKAAMWSATMEQKMRPLFVAALDALEPLEGARLLDAGCGAGLALQIASERRATVSGLDASAGLLNIARDRLPDADLRVGEIAELPYDSATFDALTAFNSVQYAVDPGGAVVELARVCRQGGKVAIGVWGDPARCETQSLFGRLRALAPPPAGTPAPLAISDPGVVEGLLEKAGLIVTGSGEVEVPFAFADQDEAFAAHASAGPLQKVIDVAGEGAVREVVRDTLEADRKPNGTLRQDNVFRYVVAAKGS